VTPTSTDDDLEQRLAEVLRAAQEPLGAWARDEPAQTDHRPSRHGRARALVAVAASVAVVGAGVGVWAARDGGDEAAAPVVVTDEPTTTTGPEPTTTVATADPTLSAVPTPVVAPTAAVGERVALTGHGEGFVALVTRADGSQIVRTSPDGTTWTERGVDLGGGTVDQLVSDGTTLTAVGVQGSFGEDRLPSAWRSTDGGATWSGGPLPLPELPALDDSILSIGNLAVAAGDDGVVVTGVVSRWLDLPTLVERQTGEAIPEGSRFEVDGTTITVTPPEGEPIVVDASGADPSIARLFDHVELGVLWRSTSGGGWEAELEPFGPDRLPYVAVAGPAGFLVGTQLAVDFPAMPEGPLNLLHRSVDGRTWEDAPMPDGMVNVPSLAWGGGRYLALLDEGVVVTSTDLRTWERAGDVVADSSVTAAGQLAGGGAGFVVVTWSHPGVAPEDRSPVVVERDGRQLTFDRGAGVVSVADVATGAELLRWEGDLDTMPPEVFAPLDGDARFLDPATGEVAFAIPIDDLGAAMQAQDQVDRDALPPPTVEVLVSADGSTWEPVTIPGDAVGADLAVSGTAVVIVPVPPPT
jgi:hypothetical protein